MIYYILRHLNNKVQIAKFGDRSYPDEVYEIQNNNCDCPAVTNNCRHKKIKNYWVNSLFSNIGIAIQYNGQYLSYFSFMEDIEFNERIKQFR